MQYRNVLAVLVAGLVLTLALVFALFNERPLGQSFVVAVVGGLVAGAIAGFRYLATLNHSVDFRLKRRLRPIQSGCAMLMPAIVLGAAYAMNNEMGLSLMGIFAFYIIGATAGFWCPRLLEPRPSSHT